MVYSGAGEHITSHRVVSNLFGSDIFEADSAGRFYVRVSLSDAVRGLFEPRHGWIRVAADGRVMDSFLHDAYGRHILATVRGELDEQYVVRLRLETPDAGTAAGTSTAGAGSP